MLIENLPPSITAPLNCAIDYLPVFCESLRDDLVVV